MITNYKTIDLFGKELFVKVEGKTPFNNGHSMPNDACFFYLKRGSLFAYSKEEKIKANNEQSLLMKCGNYAVHFFQEKEEETFEAVMVHFHPDVIKRVYNDNIPHFLKEDTSLDNKLSMAKIDASILVNKYIEDLSFYFENPILITEDILTFKVKEIILLLSKTADSEGVKNLLKGLYIRKNISFNEVVDSHVYNNLSNKELANLCHVSLSTFKRNFVTFYKTTPAKYFLTKKLEKAEELLKLSDLSISEICYDIGFNSTNHFSTKFKETHKVSPSKYRLDFLTT